MATRPHVAVFLVSLLALAGVLLLDSSAQQEELDSVTRGRLKQMLHEAHEEVKKNYYDTAIHGLDWDARYQICSDKLKQISTISQGYALVAGFLNGLNDSHTFFVPPQRAVRVEYGFQIIMVGDRPFIIRVRPDTDALSKVHPGDEVVTYNKLAPNRDTLWIMNYYYSVLSPQAASDLVLKDPQGRQREVKVDTRVQPLRQLHDLTQGSYEIWDLIREAQNADHQSRQRYYEMGDVMFWKMPIFNLSDGEVDHLFSIAGKHKALILDLRENPGGTVTTLKRMPGNVFKDDIKLADRKGRKELKPEIAKGRGKNAFTGELIVLIDSKSASAAEIFARVIQLEHRGTVIGDRSSGKVMEAQCFSERMGAGTTIFYGFSVTFADLIMKDGKSLEHVGVTPDEVVLPSASDIAVLRDPALSRAAALAGLDLDPVQAAKLFPYEWLPF